MDETTKELLAGSVRALLTEGGDPAQLGWEEVVGDDPASAWRLWFTEQGATLATTRALDDVVLGRPAGTSAVAHPWPYELSGDSVLGTGAGLVLGDLDGIEQILVPVGTGFAAVPVAGCVTEAAEGFDPSLPWHRVRAASTPSEPSEQADVAAARRALAAEILACGDRMLDLAVTHTTARTQYGRPVASFQAVRHRLAESHALLIGARGLLDVADSLAGAADSAWAAAAAKAAAGRAQRAVAASALQVCGALGLTEEFVLHRYVTRAALLDLLYGDSVRLTAALGTALLGSTGRPPVLVEIS